MCQSSDIMRLVEHVLVWRETSKMLAVQCRQHYRSATWKINTVVRVDISEGILMEAWSQRR